MRPYPLSVSFMCLVGLWGCSNPCEEALEHVNDCLQADSSDSEEEPECDDEAECKADCALAAPCEAFIVGHSMAAQDYRSCMDGC